MKNAVDGSERVQQSKYLPAGGYHRAGRSAHRSWLVCAQQVAVLAVKKPLLARTVKLAQEATSHVVSAQAPQGGRVHFCSIYHSNSAKGPEPSSASVFRQTSLALQPTMRMSFISNLSIIHLLKQQSQLDTSWAVWVSETFPSGWAQKWIVLHFFHLCACGSRSIILELFFFSSVCFSFLISDSGQTQSKS